MVTARHPANAGESLLPPRHYTFCFNVSGDKLNGRLTQKGADIALGVVFNVAWYSHFTTILAREAGLRSEEFTHTLIDAHIYVDHRQGLIKQLKRRPFALPRIQAADKPFELSGSGELELRAVNSIRPSNAERLFS